MITKTHEYQSDFARRYFARGEAKAVLGFLKARGIEVPDDVRDRITGCTDADQFDTWISRAATVDKAQDLFDE